MSKYLGINGLSHAGMAVMRGEMAYPHMKKWLQDAVPSAQVSAEALT